MIKQIIIEAVKGKDCLKCDLVMYNELVDFGCIYIFSFLRDMELPDCKDGYHYKIKMVKENV